jgi:hypothetical protein
MPAVILAPLYWAGADPILAHNVLLFLGYILSGLAAFVLLHTLTGSSTAAVITAVAVTASPYRTEYYPKVQLQLLFWIPLALTFLHRAVDRGTLRDGVLAGICLALQFYTCVNYGIAGGIFAGIVGLVVAISAPRIKRMRGLGSLGAGILLCVVLISPLRIGRISEHEARSRTSAAVPETSAAVVAPSLPRFSF